MWDELAGSLIESISEGSGPAVERKFLIRWSDRLTFAQSFTASVTAYPEESIVARVVSIDMQPWNEDVIPSGVIVDPAFQMVSYGTQGCLVTVKYGPDFTRKEWPSQFPKPVIRAGTELRYQIRGAAKFILIPCSATKWEDEEDAPVPEDANSATLVPLRQIQLQWDFVDDPLLVTIDNYQGKVNSDPFLGCEPETLLFENYQVEETFRSSILAPHTNRVTINLTSRRIDTGTEIVGWNHDYRETPPGWDRLLLSDGQPRYKSTAFAGMFA